MGGLLLLPIPQLPIASLSTGQVLSKMLHLGDAASDLYIEMACDIVEILQLTCRCCFMIYVIIALLPLSTIPFSLVEAASAYA